MGSGGEGICWGLPAPGAVQLDKEGTDSAVLCCCVLWLSPQGGQMSMSVNLVGMMGPGGEAHRKLNMWRTGFLTT